MAKRNAIGTHNKTTSRRKKEKKRCGQRAGLYLVTLGHGVITWEG